MRAPNRGPDGLRIPGVQPFLWQTSEGVSMLHAATFRAPRRPVKGIGGGVHLHARQVARQRVVYRRRRHDVAQDDQNLAAEWGLSSFDRRHQFSANVNIELPFGPNRRWLTTAASGRRSFGDWRVTTTFTWQSGTPLHAARHRRGQ